MVLVMPAEIYTGSDTRPISEPAKLCWQLQVAPATVEFVHPEIVERGLPFDKPSTVYLPA